MVAPLARLRRLPLRMSSTRALTPAGQAKDVGCQGRPPRKLVAGKAKSRWRIPAPALKGKSR
jgi:hypothetical protein